MHAFYTCFHAYMHTCFHVFMHFQDFKHTCFHASKFWDDVKLTVIVFGNVQISFDASWERRGKGLLKPSECLIRGMDKSSYNFYSG